jgi:hypothetical protein
MSDGADAMTEDNAGLKASCAARRMRMSRTRRRLRERVVPFEIRQTEVAALVAHGLLDPAQQDDRSAIAAALGRLLDRIPASRWHAAMQLRDGA